MKGPTVDCSPWTGGTGQARCIRTLARATGLGTAREKDSETTSAPRPDTSTLDTSLGGMIVLVDTSVWIRFLANKSPYAATLEALLSGDDVSGHDRVYGELLIGDTGGRTTLLSAYAQMHRAPVVSHEEVVDFVRAQRLHGLGIGWIDAHLLASALVGRLKLWTADAAMRNVAAALGVGF